MFDWEMLQRFWLQYRFRIIGLAAGLFFGWLVIVYGILKALFVAICVGIGYYIGRQVDGQEEEESFFRRWRR